MPSLMPSLLKYFAVVGGLLFAGLIGLNALLEPGGPGPRLVKDAPKLVLRIDPHATKVERLRAEEAALKAAEKANPEAHPVVVTEPLPLPQPTPQPTAMTQAAAPAVTQVAAPAVQSAPAALNAPNEAESARAVRLAQEQIAAEKARKKRLARERARARAQEASAGRQQDEIYYGYAPRPTYGPFGQGGGWQGGSWQRW